jgi:hypothetical protein
MQTMQSKRYTLPGEEPMTWREIRRAAGFVAGWVIMLAVSGAMVWVMAAAVVGWVGYP